MDILLHKVLSAPSFGCYCKRLIGGPYSKCAKFSYFYSTLRYSNHFRILFTSWLLVFGRYVFLEPSLILSRPPSECAKVFPISLQPFVTPPHFIFKMVWNIFRFGLHSRKYYYLFSHKLGCVILSGGCNTADTITQPFMRLATS